MKYYTPNWLNCLIVCPFWAKSRQVLFLKAWEINAIMKRKDSSYVRTLSDQGKLQLLQTSVNILYTEKYICIIHHACTCTTDYFVCNRQAFCSLTSLSSKYSIEIRQSKKGNLFLEKQNTVQYGIRSIACLVSVVGHYCCKLKVK